VCGDHDYDTDPGAALYPGSSASMRYSILMVEVPSFQLARGPIQGPIDEFEYSESDGFCPSMLLLCIAVYRQQVVSGGDWRKILSSKKCYFRKNICRIPGPSPFSAAMDSDRDPHTTPLKTISQGAYFAIVTLHGNRG